MIPLFRLKAGISLVLASGSPRRRDFLAAWGVPFLVRPASAEPDPEPGEDPRTFVARSASAKLEAPGWSAPELVVPADTVVVDGNHPFAGKDLTFDVTVVAIEQPSFTELESGYPDREEDFDHFDDGFDGADGEDFDDNNHNRRWR